MISGFLLCSTKLTTLQPDEPELLGNFHRAGVIDTQGTIEVNDHDFSSMGSGTLIPHGIYDVGGTTAGTIKPYFTGISRLSDLN